MLYREVIEMKSCVDGSFYGNDTRKGLNNRYGKVVTDFNFMEINPLGTKLGEDKDEENESSCCNHSTTPVVKSLFYEI